MCIVCLSIVWDESMLTDILLRINFMWGYSKLMRHSLVYAVRER